MGAPSLPPGRYFRMHMIGYFEGLDSERGIAWRCADSFSLRRRPDMTLLEIQERLIANCGERFSSSVLCLTATSANRPILSVRQAVCERRYLRTPVDRSRRQADIADRGLGRLNWAESAP